MEFTKFDGGFTPKPKGRKLGAKNSNSEQRDKAVELARMNFQNGASKIQAAREVSKVMPLPMSVETLSRLI